MKKIIGIVIGVALLGGGSFLAYQSSHTAETKAVEAAPAVAAVPPAASPAPTPVVAPQPALTETVSHESVVTAEAIDPAKAFPHALTERSVGKSNAPVVVDEFFALTCPHCAHFHKDIFPQVKKDYIDTGKIRFVFHDFIFNEVGLKGSMLTRCVPEASYEEFVTTLFQMQVSWLMPQTGEQVLRQLAGFAGLDAAHYEACLNYKALSDFLLEERVKAVNNYNIEQTPTMFVRGSTERIVGVEKYEDYKLIFDRQYDRETSGLK